MRAVKVLMCAGGVMAAPSCAAHGAAVDPAAALLGAWQDGHADLLPPGVTPLEVISSGIVFTADGRFTLTVDKATGTLHQTGRYTVRRGVVTLDFPFASACYGFSRADDGLTLRMRGTGGPKPFTLRRPPI